MNGIRLQDVQMLLLLWSIPVVIGLYIYAGRKRYQALQRFIEAGLLAKIPIHVNLPRRRWKAAALLAAMLCIILATARPAWNLKPQVIKRRGRDVVFVLDVSKSMLAQDLQPDRLERAKLAISDCLDTLRGDRVALVAFAGTAVVKCPLTLDYGFFRMILNTVSTHSVSRGGTMIGDAIRTTLKEVFTDHIKAYKDIILITDGGDQGSFPVQAAKEAGDRGIRLIAIGLGSEKHGVPIPITDANGQMTFLKYRGKEVLSKLDADTLREMVNMTPGGRYLNVATGDIDLGSVYQRLIATAPKHELGSETLKRYEQKFQIFLAVAIFLLFVEMVVCDRKKENQDHAAS